MRAYNKIKIKDIFERGDNKKRPKPARIIMGLGDGAEHTHYGPKSSTVKVKTIAEVESFKSVLAPDKTWVTWVYGGGRAPPLP